MAHDQASENKGMQILQPSEWARPSAYSHGVSASGRLVFISGQVGWNEHCCFQTTDFVAQARQALENILIILAAVNGSPEHIIRLTW